MKKILVIYYTQSGQLRTIIDQCLQTILNHPTIQVDFYNLKPVEEFPFPWTKTAFINTFPETYWQEPSQIHPPEAHILETDYDLVFIAYQPWFLSPSIPINSFLKSEFSPKILQNKWVVTLIGCRNMWAMGHEKVKALLLKNQAQLVGNIVLSDKNQNNISVLTILHWMFTGEKTRYLGFFPHPGVSDQDIHSANRFSPTLEKYIQSENWKQLQLELIKQKAVEIKPVLIMMETIGNKIFGKWAAYIQKKKHKRAKLVNWFYNYLIVAIWVVSPFVIVFYYLTYPFRIQKNKRLIATYQNI